MVATSVTQPIKIDIWSDVACPWCYIGKRHLEEGIASLGGNAPAVEVEYHSYELTPEVPVDFEGSAVDFLAERKGMPRPQVEQMMNRVTSIAAEAGLDYHFDDVKQTKTLKAHELLHFAKKHGVQGEMKERLMSAYFVEGRHVGRIDDLVDIAAEAGLDPASAREALESGRYADAVAADIAQAQAYGIEGVPFFVIDGRYGISGAQPADLFAQAIRQVAGERAEVSA